ncbi:hypothetical protein FNO01nite_24190 [Flavobacterium noncentrifugens]|uniref:Uncharacterized protein n=1 Tax=Flavobacterium noncentrifugens TaxID=1128970 RepID=A0A1G9A1M8_9FLAO|nr:DUF6155 family protein [Flavobacterium noncentrifugens]GEP51747.1 hypothetical protein FNO01nite_24190 [Flavobacterium noncentrifugens]SDK21171.1 hypothetical protein SAMN04487935_2835 [Flavobacterium noncentrifugens]
MSKRDLKKYLASMTKEQLEEQFTELYDKFGEVKTYYDFVFNPKEDKLVNEAKVKIANEYFPIKSKRPKLRRSVAQKFIKHFLILGVDAFAIADLMLFTIETAQRYSAKRDMKYASFFKSIQNAFDQAVNFCIAHGIVPDFKERLISIYKNVQIQRWENEYDFERIVSLID